MTTRRLVAFVAMSALLVGCESGPDDEEMAEKEMAAMAAMADSAKAAIEAVNMAAATALVAGDVAGWSAAYADDAIVMQPDEPAWRGKAERDAKAGALVAAMSFSNVKFASTDVIVRGDLAVETGSVSYTLTPRSGGKAMDIVGKYLTVWKRQDDGSWKIIRDINNSDGPAR